jgi:hypothetical protein
MAHPLSRPKPVNSPDEYRRHQLAGPERWRLSRDGQLILFAMKGHAIESV